MIPIKSLLGVGSIPQHRTSAAKLLARNSIKFAKTSGKGGAIHVVSLTDLPKPERLAYQLKEFDALDLNPGTYDDEGQAEFYCKPASVQEAGRSRAAIVMFVFKQKKIGLRWGDIVRAAHVEFENCPSDQTLRRYLKTVENVDPINWNAALAPDYKGNLSNAEMSDAAWDFFLASIREAAPTHALKAVWRDVRDISKAKKWAWPSYATVNRRWSSLPAQEQLTLRIGASKAAERLYQPQRRSASKLDALQWVEMDGRTLDLWVRFENGKVSRPTMIALVDRASSKVLKFVIGEGETALATRDLILETCDQYGIFDNLLTDNSRAFSSLQIAGGVEYKFRNAGTRKPAWEPPGLCEHLGIKLKFTAPANGQAKLPESKFSNLSRSVDTRPEFKGAHSGHNPGQQPTAKIDPVAIEVVRSIYLREVARYNAESGRRTQNARKGESYNDTFTRLLSDRIARPMTAHQRWRASLAYDLRTVDANGQIRVNGWVYGNDFEDQSLSTLLPYEGKKVLVGTDPSDYSKPAIIFDFDSRREIISGVQPVFEGDYESRDGARRAAKDRARLAKATREIDRINSRDLTADLDLLDSPKPIALTDQTVVQPNFEDALKTKISEKRKKEFWDRQLPKTKASGGNR